MGQKVHPVGIRLGIASDWNSKWFADTRHFPDFLETDLKVRDFLRKKLANASVSRIQIERPARTAYMAAVSPAGPPPMIMRSYIAP